MNVRGPHPRLACGCGRTTHRAGFARGDGKGKTGKSASAALVLGRRGRGRSCDGNSDCVRCRPVLGRSARACCGSRDMGLPVWRRPHQNRRFRPWRCSTCVWFDPHSDRTLLASGGSDVLELPIRSSVRRQRARWLRAPESTRWRTRGIHRSSDRLHNWPVHKSRQVQAWFVFVPAGGCEPWLIAAIRCVRRGRCGQRRPAVGMEDDRLRKRWRVSPSSTCG